MSQGEWQSPGDEIRWRYSEFMGMWLGALDGIEGTYMRSVEDFRKAYPEAPPFDGWTEEK